MIVLKGYKYSLKRLNNIYQTPKLWIIDVLLFFTGGESQNRFSETGTSRILLRKLELFPFPHCVCVSVCLCNTLKAVTQSVLLRHSKMGKDKSKLSAPMMG